MDFLVIVSANDNSSNSQACSAVFTYSATQVVTYFIFLLHRFALIQGEKKVRKSKKIGKQPLQELSGAKY